jgi:hypothetical protein
MPSLTSFLTIGNTRVKVHTTDDADACMAPKPPPAPEEWPVKEIILDKAGRLLIDVVDNTPHCKQTYRHRVSLEAMEQASPVWKEKIFGPEGQEREKPTANADEEDRIVLLRDDDDEPLPILVQLALIHDQPRWVPTWSDPATPGSCLQIANIIAAAEKYGVLPRLRPFVSDWLLHALPPSRIGGQDDINPEMIEQLNVAWQLGDVGRVDDYIRKLAYDSNVSAEVVKEMLVEAGEEPVDRFPALPELFGVAAKRREAGIQAGLDFLARLIGDLNSDEGVCRQPMWDPTIIPGYTPEAFANIEKLLGRSAVDDHATNCDMCRIILEMEFSKRIEEAEPIPSRAKDFHSTVSHLLYMIRCIHGLEDGAAPARQVPGHACLQNLRKKFEDFAAELRSRWSGTESILELEQVEWLKTRCDVLATGGSS